MQFREQFESISNYLFENIIYFHSDIVKICVKIDNYKNIEFLLEEHSKILNIEYNLLVFLLHGVNHSIMLNFNITQLLGIKSIRERFIERFSVINSPITIEEMIILNNFKDFIIISLKNRIIDLDNTISAINMNFQSQIQNINSLQKGIDLRIETMSSLFEPPMHTSDLQSVTIPTFQETPSPLPSVKLKGLPKENISFNYLNKQTIWK